MLDLSNVPKTCPALLSGSSPKCKDEQNDAYWQPKKETLCEVFKRRKQDGQQQRQKESVIFSLSSNLSFVNRF